MDVIRLRGTASIGVLTAIAATVLTTAGTAHAEPGAAYIEYGDTGRAVVCVQFAVIQAGYNAGSVDGEWGRITDGAVRAFQQANFGYADGVVGPQSGSELWEIIEETDPVDYGDCYRLLPTYS